MVIETPFIQSKPAVDPPNSLEIETTKMIHENKHIHYNTNSREQIIDSSRPIATNKHLTVFHQNI